MSWTYNGREARGRVVHGLGQPAGWIGLYWVGLSQSFPPFSGLAWVMGFSWQLAKNEAFYLLSIFRATPERNVHFITLFDAQLYSATLFSNY